MKVTDNKSLVVAMAFLIIVFTLAFSQTVFADLCWQPPTARTDNTQLPLSEISGYKIRYGDISGGPYNNALTVNDGSATCYPLQVSTDKYAVMTTLDTGGRESDYSTIVFVPGTELIPLSTPSYVSDLTFINEEGTLNYAFAWTNPTTFKNGELLPEGVINKHFLIINGEWVRDIPGADTSVVWTLEPGENTVQIETEIKINVQAIVSGNSDPVIVSVPVDVPVVIPDTLPPTTIEYTIPEGYRKIVLTITPVE